MQIVYNIILGEIDLGKKNKMVQFVWLRVCIWQGTFDYLFIQFVNYCDVIFQVGDVL